MSLKRINEQSVHQICSGQVVLSLAIAVKELVENSLDAGATHIEVRLKEFGSEQVEVVDDGCGVDPNNYQSLTLKHYTSKISDFSDIATVDTFGFRGEALSSLCALSDLVITTCFQEESVGACIVYDNNGKIKSQAKCARERGTTVSLSNLFHTLPVRQKEFHRNLKKEYSKLIHMLQGYCLISTGIKISCYNQTGKIKRQLVLSNSGSSQMRSNISCIFGPTQIENIVEILQCLGESIVTSEGPTISAEMYDRFRLSGYISKCNHGNGRSSTDRQFFFFNGRPCDHTKLSKTVNEVYHIYNHQQYPFVVMNIETQRECVDVNVTPDKRQVMIQQEKALLTLVRESLLQLFQPMAGHLSTSPSPSTPLSQTSSFNNRPFSSLKRAFSYSQSSSSPSSQEPSMKQPRLMDFGITKSQTTSSNKDNSSQSNQSVKLVKPVSITRFSNVSKNDTTKETITLDEDQSHDLQSCDDVVKMKSSPEIGDEAPLPLKVERIKYDTDHLRSTVNKTHTLDFNMADIVARAGHMTSKCGALQSKKRRYFYARIQPDSNQDAEDELKRELNKEQFEKMEVLGQFNLGFIITKLDNDLFIIDQHATDEKFNFERLKRDTVIEQQKLLQPRPLELTAIGEAVLKDNLEIFEKNGFSFIFDEAAPPTKRVCLVGQPVSKNWSMGIPEIEELIFLLTDYPGEMVRPHCVTKMLASRACRGSIMIGTALDKKEMSKLVVHMGEMKQPWNCPHGRPTIRHLVDLSRLSS